ncbi:prepilin-type N-terminal cleavage/methylation domain-containing protein [Thermodesulfobacteriota bacterium]
MYREERAEIMRSRENGFTLVEILVAIAILAFGIMAIATMQSSSLRATQHSYNVTEGTTWAQDKLEELMTLPYSQITTGQDTSNPYYTVAWNVSAGPVTNTQTVTVNVTWIASGGAQKVSSLEYIVADII